MEMTKAYMEEAAAWFEARGYTSQREEETLAPDDKGRVCEVVKFYISKDKEAFVLEWAAHPAAPLRFFLEIERYGALRSPCFPLDSWRLHADRVEMKLSTDPTTGLGHTFVLDLGPASPTSSPDARPR